MRPSPNIFRHALREATRDLTHWAKEHILASCTSLLASLLGMPAYLLLGGATMSTLLEQLASVVAYSFAGPTLLILAAYLYFSFRAPFRLYASRINELRDLRIRLQEPIEDLEEPPPSPNRIRNFISKYAYPVVVVALLSICVWLFNLVANVGRVLMINDLAVRSYQADTVALLYLESVLADKIIRICTDNKLNTPDCEGSKAFAKKLLSLQPYHGQHVPKNLDEFLRLNRKAKAATAAHP